MRVAFISAEYPPRVLGGAGVYAQKLTESLTAEGVEVHVFTMGEGTSTLPNGIIVHRITGPNRSTFRFWSRLRTAVKSEERKFPFDVIHYNGVSSWFFRRASLVPQIMTVHHPVTDAAKISGMNAMSRLLSIGSEEGYLVPWLEKRGVRQSDHIIAVSEYTRSRMSDLYGRREHISIIPSGVEIQTGRADEELIKNARAIFGLQNGHLILYVGRVDDRRKGLDLLIEARALMHTDAHLVIVGKGETKGAEDLADMKGIRDKMHFCGFVDAPLLHALYSLCDVYVCPSRLEGFGITLVEAMAAGTPMVVFGAGAIPEIVEDGVNGLVIPPNDINALSIALDRCLEDNDLVNTFRRNNLSKATKLCRWPEVAARVIQVYQDMTMAGIISSR